MSDIDIRLDGILLGLTMIVGIVLFAAIAVISMLRAFWTSPNGNRPKKIAARSAALAVSHVLGLAILAGYLDRFGSSFTGPDWIDRLALPWLVFIVLGVVLLVRTPDARSS